VVVGRTPHLGSLTCRVVLRCASLPDPSVHPAAFSVNHLGAVPVYDVVDTWWTVVPKKAAAVAETSTIIQLKSCFLMNLRNLLRSFHTTLCLEIKQPITLSFISLRKMSKICTKFSGNVW